MAFASQKRPAILIAVLAFLFCTSPLAATGAEPDDEPSQAQAISEAPALEDASEQPRARRANARPSFRWTGEELFYSIRINSTEAMRAGVRLGQVRQRQGNPYIAVNGMVRSRGFFDAVYPVDDQANTYFDPQTFFPIRSEKIFDENNRLRSYDVDYLHPQFIAQVERLRSDRHTRFQKPIPPETHDMITWVYHLRDVGGISLGDRFSYYIYDGWWLSRLDLVVAAREDLLTPMGWFKTWRIDFERQVMDTNANFEEDAPPQPPEVTVRRKRQHTGSMWFSRDVNFLPVRVTVDTILGPGEAVIIGYTPGRPQ